MSFSLSYSLAAAVDWGHAPGRSPNDHSFPAISSHEPPKKAPFSVNLVTFSDRSPAIN
jgi:hypothetical protein